MSTAGAVGRKTVGRIARVIFGAAVTAAVLSGCISEKPEDEDLVGDWLVVGYQYGYDGEVDIVDISTWSKLIFSFDPSGGVRSTFLYDHGNFWVEVYNGFIGECKIESNSIFFNGSGAVAKYSISGNTLTFGITEHDYTERYTAVRVNVANFKKSLGKVYGQDPALIGTEWRRPSESGNHYDRIRFYLESDFDISVAIYWSGYYDDETWYTEGSRLFLVGQDCARYETKYDSDGDSWKECVSYSIAETVTLDYRLSDGNKTLRLRPAGSSGEWDVWTLDGMDYYYSQSKSLKH